MPRRWVQGYNAPAVTTARQIVIAAEVIDEALEGLRRARERPRAVPSPAALRPHHRGGVGGQGAPAAGAAVGHDRLTVRRAGQPVHPMTPDAGHAERLAAVAAPLLRRGRLPAPSAAPVRPNGERPAAERGDRRRPRRDRRDALPPAVRPPCSSSHARHVPRSRRSLALERARECRRCANRRTMVGVG
jgi:hypothetical protein